MYSIYLTGPQIIYISLSIAFAIFLTSVITRFAVTRHLVRHHLDEKTRELLSELENDNSELLITLSKINKECESLKVMVRAARSALSIDFVEEL